MTRSQQLDFELAQMNVAHRAAVKSAAETLLDAMDDEFDAYESPPQERIALLTRIRYLLRELSCWMK
jgi:hypothetical protein